MSSTVDEIAIKLGVNTGDLKAALADANVSVKSFANQAAADTGTFTSAIHDTHQAMRLFHQFMVAGGIVEAMKSFYTMCIDYANQHKEATDSQTQAVRDFGAALKDSGGAIAEVATQVLGFFNEAGEGWGDLIASLIHGQEAAMKAQAINVAAEQNLADIAAARKETLTEIARLQQTNADLETKNEWTAFQLLDHETQRATLAADIVAKLAEAATLEENSLKFQTLKRDILTEQEKLQALITEDDKADNAEQEASIKKQTSYEDQQAKARNAAILAYNQMLFDQMSTQDKINTLTAKQQDLQTYINGLPKNSTEYMNQSVALAAVTKQLNALINLPPTPAPPVVATDTYVKQLQLDWNNFQGTFNSVGGSVSSLSDVQLQGLILKLQNQQSSQRLPYGNNTAAEAYDPVLQETNLMLANAQAEAQTRANYKTIVSAFGQNYAEANLDAPTYNRLSQLYSGTLATAQATNISTIAGTLVNLFPNQAPAAAV